MQKVKTKKRGFVISSMLDIKNNNFLFFLSNLFYNLLNLNLELINYTEKQKEIALIFMAINPKTHSFRPDKKFWRWKAKNFDMYLNVPDYEAFCKADKKGAKKIVAELYLTAIKKYLSKQKDFKHKLFYKDVKELFENEGILEK